MNEQINARFRLIADTKGRMFDHSAIIGNSQTAIRYKQNDLSYDIQRIQGVWHTSLHDAVRRSSTQGPSPRPFTIPDRCFRRKRPDDTRGWASPTGRGGSTWVLAPLRTFPDNGEQSECGCPYSPPGWSSKRPYRLRDLYPCAPSLPRERTLAARPRSRPSHYRIVLRALGERKPRRRGLPSLVPG